ncbi:hypothetical protein B2J96_17195 [Mycobacterium shigaense]|nr:hypothetical protein B2J96_17195 [Mycobacterium shigaense]
MRYPTDPALVGESKHPLTELLALLHREEGPPRVRPQALFAELYALLAAGERDALTWPAARGQLDVPRCWVTSSSTTACRQLQNRGVMETSWTFPWTTTEPPMDFSHAMA